MNDSCISIILFYKSKCARAEKNSELSKTSKMKLLEKIAKIFKNTIFVITFILDVGFKHTSEEYLFWKYPEI